VKTNIVQCQMTARWHTELQTRCSDGLVHGCRHDRSDSELNEQVDLTHTYHTRSPDDRLQHTINQPPPACKHSKSLVQWQS